MSATHHHVEHEVNGKVGHNRMLKAPSGVAPAKRDAADTVKNQDSGYNGEAERNYSRGGWEMSRSEQERSDEYCRMDWGLAVMVEVVSIFHRVED